MNSTHDQTLLCEFGLKSTNVILEHHHEPVDAIILIKNDKIFDIKIIRELDSESLDTLYKQWNIQDYGNLLIFPGLIDSNVHLHSGYNSEWDNISYATSLAAMGGVTTVIDNPIMTKPFKTGQEYLKILQERIDTLKTESHVDFGLYGLLEDRTEDYIADMLKLGVVGLKCYLLSCFQHNIGHIDSERLVQLFDKLDHEFPELLLAIHPEIATDRELYHSSPCRFVDKDKRLDLEYEILPLELGGAANKGSFLDDFKEAKESKKGSDDLDDEFDTGDINTPSKLKPQIKKSKEKAEVNNIAYFELLSYGGTESKAKSNESSAESDDEFKSNEEAKTDSGSEKLKIPLVFAEEGQKAKKTYASSLNKEEKIIEVDSDENGMTPTPSRLTAPLDYSIKKSFFAPKLMSSNDEDAKAGDTVVVGILKTPRTEEDIDKIDKEKGDLSSRFRNKACKETKKTSFDVSSPSEKSSRSRGSESPGGGDYTPVEKKPDISIESDNNPQEVKRFATRVALFTVKSSTEIRGGYSERPVTTDDTSDDKTDSQEIPKFKKKLEIDTQFEENSPGPRKNSSNSSLSPAKRTLTPSSSLLNRRMSRKISGNFLPPSTKSNASSPDSDLSRVSFLDINKSPDNYRRTQGFYNKSYRVFLANRSLGWEDNGLSTILKALEQKSKLRVLVQNLSLASSFYKIRMAKKASEVTSANFYGDSGIAYLVFSEKAVKKGETKYKAAPPLREKENRRLLVENFRLGGIDILSSYHFYVPPRFKNVDDGNFRRAFNGFNVIGFTLQAIWTAMYNYYNNKSNKFSVDLFYQKKIVSGILRKIFEALCLNPAKMLKIDHRKGSIAIGKDADFVIWDPSKSSKAQDLHISHLFCDKIVLGVVHKTILRGKVIYDKDNGAQVQEGQKVEFISP